MDSQRPWARSNGPRLPAAQCPRSRKGADIRVDLAIQGPHSREVLLALGCSPDDAGRLAGLKWAGLMEGRFGDFNLVVSRTGYTGERVAFELFVHPDRALLSGRP